MKGHCHYTGKYCGTTLQYKKRSFTPVMAHNMSGFDGHLVLLKTAEQFKECNILVVGKKNWKFSLFS